MFISGLKKPEKLIINSKLVAIVDENPSKSLISLINVSENSKYKNNFENLLHSLIQQQLQYPEQQRVGLGIVISSKADAVAHLKALDLDISSSEVSVLPVDQRTREIYGWFNANYLGYEASRLFARFPPWISEVSEQFFKLYDTENTVFGLYFPGSNHVIINSMPRTEADRIKTIIHELFHYISRLGGGGFIFTLESEKQSPKRYIKWLDEGLTEMHAQELARANGVNFKNESYPLEVLFVKELRKLVGAEVLKKAYLTGDFTGVKSLLDHELGLGTFDKLLSSSSALEAIRILLSSGGVSNKSALLSGLMGIAMKLETPGIIGLVTPNE